MGDKIRVLIVEDRQITARHIQQVVQQFGFDAAGPYASGEEALKNFEKDKPDMALLDVELAGSMDGVDVAAKIREISGISPNFPILFLTDHLSDELEERVLKVRPSNYLSKPFDDRKLVLALNIAIHNASAEKVPEKAVPPAQNKSHEVPGVVNDSIFVSGRERVHYKIPLDDIIWIESEGSYINLVTEKKKHVLTTTNLGILEQVLPQNRFARVHRSFIVNLLRVESFSSNGIQLRGASEAKNLQDLKKVMRGLSGKVPIAPQYRSSFEKRFRLI